MDITILHDIVEQKDDVSDSDDEDMTIENYVGNKVSGKESTG